MRKRLLFAWQAACGLYIFVGTNGIRRLALPGRSRVRRRASIAGYAELGMSIAVSVEADALA